MRLRLPWHAARRSHAKGRFLLTTRSLRTDHEREGMRSASKTASGDADQAALLSTQDAKVSRYLSSDANRAL